MKHSLVLHLLDNLPCQRKLTEGLSDMGSNTAQETIPQSPNGASSLYTREPWRRGSVAKEHFLRAQPFLTRHPERRGEK